MTLRIKSLQSQFPAHQRRKILGAHFAKWVCGLDITQKGYLDVEEEVVSHNKDVLKLLVDRGEIQIYMKDGSIYPLAIGPFKHIPKEDAKGGSSFIIEAIKVKEASDVDTIRGSFGESEESPAEEKKGKKGKK